MLILILVVAKINRNNYHDHYHDQDHDHYHSEYNNSETPPPSKRNPTWRSARSSTT